MRSWSEAQDAARVLQLTLRSEEVRGPADFDRVFAEMIREHPAALLLISDGLVLQHALQSVDFAARNRIPSMLEHSELVAAGALIGCGRIRSSVTVLDERGRLLMAALGFAGCSMPSRHSALHALRSWLDSWAGIGRLAAHTRADSRAWRFVLVAAAL